MLIDVARPGSWEELNDEIKSYLHLSEKNRARVYHGLSQGVFEASQGTAQFMAHKKSVAVVTGQSPLVPAILPYYYKETYEVQKISHTELLSPKEWVESLKKDTCFVLFNEDHPVTGERYPFAEELDRLLNEKRIFSFRVSHRTHLFGADEVRPYTVHLRSYGAELCVAVCGERYRTPSLMAHAMSWNNKEVFQYMSPVLGTATQDQQLVQTFEDSIAKIGRAFFPRESVRTWDRAVCVFSDVSGDALALKLFEKMQLAPEEGWKHLATTNMCSWDVVNMFGSWWEPDLKIEDLRGLLVIGVPILAKEKKLFSMLQDSYSEIKNQQNWKV